MAQLSSNLGLYKALYLFLLNSGSVITMHFQPTVKPLTGITWTVAPNQFYQKWHKNPWWFKKSDCPSKIYMHFACTHSTQIRWIWREALYHVHCSMYVFYILGLPLCTWWYSWVSIYWLYRSYILEFMRSAFPETHWDMNTCPFPSSKQDFLKYMESSNLSSKDFHMVFCSVFCVSAPLVSKLKQ